MEKAKSDSEITNYISRHGVLIINKLGKVRVVFDACAKFHKTSLNNNLLPGVEFYKNLIFFLLQFREVRFAVIADTEKKFQQLRVTFERY